MDRPSYTVTELNNRIKAHIELEPDFSRVYVRGELSNYRIYPSGHHYFTLKDEQSSIKCVMFRSSAARLRFRPESGMSVMAYGDISVYPRDGAYQLYCSNMSPEGTGDLQLAFEQLKAKLEAEGLFDERCKKPLPVFPQRIAVVTSSAGAAVHDMIRILGSRWPLSKVLLLPVRVQGVEAPPEIAAAINYANEHQLADLIITGRGGGSIEDLWAFNDERVARAIFASRIPVISAVGHEPDVTISDYVADVRASTPSNAAELAVPDMNDMLDSLRSLELRAGHAMTRRLQLLSDRLRSLAEKRVLTEPAAYIDNRRIDLDRKRDRLLSAQQKKLDALKRNFAASAAALDAMSPLKVLGRGYALVNDAEGRLLKNTEAVSKGDSINIRMSDGVLDCVVNDIRKDNYSTDKR